VTDKTILLPPTSANGHDAAYRLTVMVPKRRYLSYLRERWWVVVACLGLSLGGVLIYETLRTVTFTSYAQLFVSSGALAGASLFSDSRDDYATQIELLKGIRIQRAAIAELGSRVDLLKTPIDVEVVRPMGTAILQLRATGTDPVLTQSFLQALIDKYLAFKKETRVTTTEDLVASLTEQLAKREAELKVEQEKWVGWQKTNNVAALEEESHSAAVHLAEVNLELSKLKLEEAFLEKGLSPTPAPALLVTNAPVVSAESTNAYSTNSDVPTVTATVTNTTPSMASDASLRSARLELAVAMSERATTVARFSELHPSVRALDSAIQRLTNTVAILEQQNAQEKQRELVETQGRIAVIEAALPGLEKQVLDTSGRLSESQRHKNDFLRQQNRYDSLIGVLQNVDLNKNIAQERITVLDPPSPAVPSQRTLPLRIVLAVAGGLFFSLGLVFVWHLLDDRFVSVRDVKDNFGETVLGLIPEIKVARTRPRDALLTEGDTRRSYAESYRHLRSSLLLSALAESRPHTLLFTGAAPTEGKSTIAVNLARVLARSGLRVVLVDADTHTAGLGHLLEADGKPGMLDYLRGEKAVGAVVHPTDVPGLGVVPSGTHTEHAEGLFLRPQLATLLTELKAGRDFVIIDGPPILGADDAALLVPYADTVVMVVRPFFTQSRLVRQALEMVYHRQAKQVAIILNRARKDDLAGHYGRNGVATAAIAQNGK
jgi:capsular exopolysaccharide synthesis family protein